MSGIDELNERRAKEAERIRLALNRQRGIARANIKGGKVLLLSLRKSSALARSV